MEAVRHRQVAGGVTRQIGSYQFRLIVLAKVNLPLPLNRSRRCVDEPRCTLSSDNVVKTLQIEPCIRVGKRVQETLNLLHTRKRLHRCPRPLFTFGVTAAVTVT